MPPLQGLQFYNDKMLTLTEHYDDFIMARTLSNPNVWHDRIPRGAYKLFNGLEQKTNIYRGGLGVQAGLNTWAEIGPSRKPAPGDPGYDNCAIGTPQTYGYGWETVAYSGYKDHWQSEPLCLNDLKYVDYAKDQIALIMRTGVDFGISMLENFNREMYIQQAMLSNRGMLMATGALAFEENAAYRFTYDPFLVMTDADGEEVPYITFPAAAELSTLNWDFLDYLRTSLADRAHEAALGKDSNMPIFGLMLDYLDFERMVKSDEELRQDWRDARASTLIDGYNMGMKTYRGFALIHDPRQPRFRVHNINADGNMVCTRVKPQKLGRQLTIGFEPVPNPEYFRAEVGLGVIFMNDVLTNLFVPSIDNLGSGTTFGPAPGLTGQWQWVNIKDNVTNQLGESGYFYGRFEIFPKPMLFSSACTVFAYRRCAHALRTVCAVQDAPPAVATALGITRAVVAADLDLTNRRVTLALAGLVSLPIGTAFNITRATGEAFAAVLIGDGSAPDYTFTWAADAANRPTEADASEFVQAEVSVVKA